MESIRILIADDHNLVRHGLINMISEAPEIFVVGEAEDGLILVDKFRELLPDIVLSDVSMPKLNGFYAAEKILQSYKNAKFIFLSALCSNDFIKKAFYIGAYGMLPKDIVKSELLLAINTVAQGKKYFVGKTENELNYLIAPKFEQDDIISIDVLSDHEIEILSYIGKGYTSEEIGQQLSLTKTTVNKARSVIMEKLKIKALPSFIKFAVEYNFKKDTE